jgi:hypothetical protein
LYLLDEVQRNDGMRPGTALVHESSCDRSVVGAFIDFLCYLFIGIDTELLESLDIDSQGLVLTYFELLLLVFGQKITHVLIVDL